MKRDEFSAKVREQALARVTDKDGNSRCQHCKAILKAKRFDHHLAAELGGPATLENCQVLCIQCHAEKTAKEIRGLRKAERAGRKARGTKKPTDHPIPKRVGPMLRAADKPKATATPEKLAGLPRRNLYR